MPHLAVAGSDSPGSPADDSRWRRIFLVASTVGTVSCAAIALLSFLPFVPPAPAALWGTLFAGIFAVHLRSVFVLIRARSGRGQAAPHWDRMRARIEHSWWAWLVVFLAIVCFATGVSAAPGQPEIDHGRYFLDNHGSLIPVSHGTYLRALAAQARIFTGVAAVFYAAGVIVNAREAPDSPAAESRSSA